MAEGLQGLSKHAFSTVQDRTPRTKSLVEEAMSHDIQPKSSRRHSVSSTSAKIMAQQPREFAGKLAIVTGAAKQNGIGFATALTLAKTGADIVLHYNKNAAAAEQSVQMIKDCGVNVISVQADASSTDFGERLVQATVTAFPDRTIDIIVNNAADIRFAPLLDPVSTNDFDAVFRANVRGPLLLLQAAMPRLLSPGGRVINIGTVAAKLGSRHANLYSASKGALNAMTTSWAVELGDKGITANVVAPGPIDTDWVPQEEHELTVKFRSAQHLKRNGSAQEVADAVVFVASEKSSFISGQIIAVDGGLNIP